MREHPFTFAITSLKPHAGRTTGCMALAWALGRAGYRVLVVDANQYASIVPRKSKTGSAEIWKDVVIGSRKAGEAASIGAHVVLVDAPPLTAPAVEPALRVADAVLVSIFPIAQNQRFLEEARGVLETVEPERVFGWSVAKINPENAYHADLARGLEGEMAGWSQRTSIPEGSEIPDWDWYAGQDLPEGPVRSAYQELADAVVAGLPGPEELRAQAAQRAAAQESKEKKERRREKRRPAPERSATAPERPAADAPPAPAIPLERAPEPAVAPEPAAAPAEPRAALPEPTARAKRRPPKAAPSASWRLLGDGRPAVHVSLHPAEGRIALPDGLHALPEPVPAAAVRAMLHFGWIHGITPESRTRDGACPPCRPRSREAPTLAPASQEDPLHGACRALLDGDADAARSHLERESESVDACFLAGMLALAHDERPRGLEHVVTNASTLGVDLKRLGVTAVVSVELGHGISTHFGVNQRGARLGLTLARHALGDEAGFLGALDRLVRLEPDDLLLRTLRVEWVLDHGSMGDLEVLHRSMLTPSYRTPIDTVLALHRAEGLHRLGLPDAASLALREVQARVPEGWASLRTAIEHETHEALESLARVQRVRHDLEQATELAGG